MEVKYVTDIPWTFNQLAKPVNFTGLANTLNDPNLSKQDNIFQRADGSLVNYFGNDTIVNNTVVGGQYSTGLSAELSRYACFLC